MITSFTGEHNFLSNFFPCQVEFEGLLYPSTENAYQAAKTLDLSARAPFQNYSSGQAKRAGRKLKPYRTDWEEVKWGIMLDLNRKKFSDPHLGKLLICTGEQALIEGNDWGDREWGCVWNGRGWEGDNKLGDILMKIRDELRIFSRADSTPA